MPGSPRRAPTRASRTSSSSTSPTRRSRSGTCARWAASCARAGGRPSRSPTTRRSTARAPRAARRAVGPAAARAGRTRPGSGAAVELERLRAAAADGRHGGRAGDGRGHPVLPRAHPAEPDGAESLGRRAAASPARARTTRWSGRRPWPGPSRPRSAGTSRPGGGGRSPRRCGRRRAGSPAGSPPGASGGGRRARRRRGRRPAGAGGWAACQRISSARRLPIPASVVLIHQPRLQRGRAASDPGAELGGRGLEGIGAEVAEVGVEDDPAEPALVEQDEPAAVVEVEAEARPPGRRALPPRPTARPRPASSAAGTGSPAEVRR